MYNPVYFKTLQNTLGMNPREHCNKKHPVADLKIELDGCPMASWNLRLQRWEN